MAERRFSIFRRKPETKAAGEVTVTPPLVQMLQLLDGSPSNYGEIYRHVSPVRTVVDFLADAVATTPIKVYRRQETGRPEVREHPLAVLLRNPNPDITTRTLIWRTTGDLAIYGNAYWRKVQTPAGQKMLVPLPPFRVTPRGGDLLSASVYDVWRQDGLPPVRYSRDEIVHFRFYDPEEPRIGSSKLAALRSMVLEEIEASRYRRGFWAHSAQLEGVLEHPGNLSEPAIERLEARWDQRYSGADNAGRTPILEEGMHWQQTSVSAKDAEFLEGRRFVLESVARCYNLPLSLLSLTETATYASQREFHKQLYTEVLPPWYELIQSEIELNVLPWFVDTRNIYVEFVAESKLRGDFIDRAQVLNTAIGRPWMTVEEGRGVENLDSRGVDEDAELVIPVGPNFALEGAPTAPPLPATVTALPTAQTASALTAFFDRQERSVRPRLASNHEKPFDRGRWDAELGAIIGRGLAQRVNLQTEVELASGEDPRTVFDRRRAAAADLTRTA